MTKYIKQKNRLKDLIYIQENKPCSEQSVKGIFRSLIEPVLGAPEEDGVVLYRLNNKQDYSSFLQRLKYSNVAVYDFSKDGDALKEDIWEDTEFLMVLTHRYGASFVWDYEVEATKGFAGYYILHNSKKLSDTFDIIKENSTEDISEYQEQFKPDRRDNELMNESIRNIVDMLNETTQEAVITGEEKSTLSKNDDLAKRLEFINAKSRYVVHELRNQLSICELYSNIISKFCTESQSESCKNAIRCIKSAVSIANSSLMDLKSLNNNDLEVYTVKEIVDEAVMLAKIYADGKEISISIEHENEEVSILAEKNKFMAAIINLIKNAVEAIEDKGEIFVSSEIKEDFVSIVVKNNGKEIPTERQKNIFDDGFTTKTTGNGIGLYVCKKSLEEQFARLQLVKSDKDSTEFEILASIV